MSETRSPAEQHNILEEGWNHVVGGMEWLQSVIYGEFSDHRSLSAVVADMLLSFVPGVVIVTSARDAVAVILRLATHPEKREELMEWVLLCACMIVIALPIALAAGGAAAAGVGAVVGGIAGSELGAALRAVMLMLIKEASKLVEVVQFLQKFINGDVLKFLRAVKFVKYEKALLQAFSKILGKLVDIVKSLRLHLESLRYFDSVKATVAKLVEWEKKFYNVQQDAIRQIPKALAELDARLGKVLAETAPKEQHTVIAGVCVDKITTPSPAIQRVQDVPGKILERVKNDSTSIGRPVRKEKTPTISSRAKPKAPPKQNLNRSERLADGPNSKKQAASDAALVAEREKITQLSNEARDAEKNGNELVARAKIEEARTILRPYLPKHPNDSWEAIIERLDVSSPKNGAVFWSGDPKAAQKFANEMNGVTLETTPGGRVIDGWDEVNKGYTWDERFGTGPYAKDLWSGASGKYAEGATGHINTVQTPEKLWDEGTLWQNDEKIIIQDKLQTGEVTGITMHTLNNSGEYIPLSKNYVTSLLKLQGRIPK